MKHKTFVLMLGAVLAGFVCFNAVVWHFFTKKILVRSPAGYVGDLARIGYLPQYAAPRQNTDDLPRRHFELADYQGQPCPVVTMGDSFSNGLGFGRNRYYQDFLATGLGLNVLNLPPLTNQKNLLQDIVILANSNYLSTVGAKYFVLQMAERNFLTRGNAPCDMKATMPTHVVTDIYDGMRGRPIFFSELPDVRFINTGNIKFIVNQTGFLFKSKSLFGDIRKLDMTRRLFDHPHGNTLIFLDKDIRKQKYATDQNLEEINKSLNGVGRVLAAKGVTLCVIVAPNKYSVYSKYLVDGRHDGGSFYERFKKLDKDYLYVDLFQPFLQYVDEGGLDLYYIDDTHWSDRAAKILAESFVATVNSRGT